MIRCILCVWLMCTLPGMVWAQGGGLTSEDESALYASTKLVNQFFRRFNGEEDEKGKRYYEGDRNYRLSKLRQKYLPILFDASNANISNELKKAFVTEVAEKKDQLFLDFHGEDYFAEVNAVFDDSGSESNVIMFMTLQQERLGYEWVIDDVDARKYRKLFGKDTTANKKFIHPMSHELDFMTLRKALQDNERPEDYTPHEFRPDYLTLFLYELKTGQKAFKTVENVKFHFFQIDGWYFEISNFNRSGYNTGWLISNLAKLKPGEDELLKSYLYGKS
ncbi:MAG: hypothetical protein AAGC88_06560 [Bacteroidota bacterium]